MKEKREKTKQRHAPLGKQIEDSDALVVRKRNPTKVKKSETNEAESVRQWSLGSSHISQFIEAKLSSKILQGAREQQDDIDAEDGFPEDDPIVVDKKTV